MLKWWQGYTMLQALEEMKDKISDEEKANVTAECEKVKEALKGTDTDAIKAASDA